MAPILGLEDVVLVVLVLLVLSIAAVVVEVEVEVELLLLLPSLPSIWKMAESRRSEKPFRGKVKLAPPFPLFPNCQDQELNHARWNKKNKGSLTLHQ